MIARSTEADSQAQLDCHGTGRHISTVFALGLPTQ